MKILWAAWMAAVLVLGEEEGIFEVADTLCPFATWEEKNETRSCWEGEWCAYREVSCCEMWDEWAVLKGIQVSGGNNWDCFITLVHFSECGKCSPDSWRYWRREGVHYAPHPAGSIRMCPEACGYVWDRCRMVSLLDGSPFTNLSKGEFCEDTGPDGWCFNSGLRTGTVTPWALAVGLAALVALGWCLS